jgi:histidine phosphotransferase ChpT
VTESELAGLVCARICHDLSSPVGALVNGVDLVRELAPGEATEELAMVEQTAARAAALLKFHRLAFGAIVDAEARLLRKDLRSRVEEALAGPRVSFGWTALEGPPIATPIARLTCLMLLSARRILGLGGPLRIVLPALDALPLAVIAEGDRVAVSAEQRQWLAGEMHPLPDSRQIEFVLAPLAARNAGARLVLSEGGGQAALRAIEA